MIIDCLFAVAMSRAGSSEWSAEVIIDCLFAVAMSRAATLDPLVSVSMSTATPSEGQVFSLVGKQNQKSLPVFGFCPHSFYLVLGGRLALNHHAK